MQTGDADPSERSKNMPFDYHARLDHHVNNKKEYTAKVALGVNK